MAIQIGDIFGDYQVVGVLGKGGMGKVFRVRSVLTDREEAMKVVLPDMDENAELADRFLREIKVHASLEHPNIAELRAAMRVQGRIVMIMELINGDSLDDLIRGGPLELPTSIFYVDQVLSALDYAHSRGVVHRDIKPANILVTGPGSGHPGVVKLTDFGIAQAAGAGRLTNLGMVVGSLWYMSPEQIRSEPVDARSDLYSLGLTFYQMVTGQRPINATSDYALLNAQLTQMPVAPSDVVPGLPRSLSDVMMRVLAKRPEDRFASAREFKMALRGSMMRVPTATMDPTVSLQRPSPPMPAAPPQSTPPQSPPTSPTAAPPTAQESRNVHLPFDAAFLSKATQLLAPHIGPIAKVVVTRAAKSAQSETDLLHAVAAELPSEADRKRFLAAMRG